MGNQARKEISILWLFVPAVMILLPFVIDKSFYTDIWVLMKSLWTTEKAEVLANLLNVVYVVVIAVQLTVMQRQLRETRRGQEMQAQPLPWVFRPKVSIEEPALFFEKQSAYFASRYRLSFLLRNVGTSPAVSLSIQARLIVPSPTEIHLDRTKEIPVIEEKQNLQATITFFGDVDGSLLRSLRESQFSKLPHLKMRVLYRNVLGGHFVAYHEFLLQSKDDSILQQWLTRITTFPIVHKGELDRINAMLTRSDGHWYEYFLQVREANRENEPQHRLNVSPLRGGFRVEALSDKEFAEISNDPSYNMDPTTLPDCLNGPSLLPEAAATSSDDI